METCQYCGLTNSHSNECQDAVVRLERARYREALEEIVCMQHMHEGNGGCHGPCPVCRASVALGLHKYLKNPGDRAKLAEFQAKYEKDPV